jgi:hypothetical protein
MAYSFADVYDTKNVNDRSFSFWTCKDSLKQKLNLSFCFR